MLVRFGTERLLYRLSSSPEAARFLLKGATLFSAWGGAPHRMTKDADLLGFGDPSPPALERLFRGLAGVDTAGEDGLRFEPASVRVEEIREDSSYGGVRVTLRATLDGAVIPLQVDVAYGEAVDPEPEEVELPVILALPAPRLRAYPREVVIAEKFEAMVKLGVANSRMKDYYDVWYLAKTHRFDAGRLRRAVSATFGRRGTAIPEHTPIALSDEFALDASRIRMWESFLEKAVGRVGVGLDERPSLAEVVGSSRPFLMNIAVSAGSSADA